MCHIAGLAFLSPSAYLNIHSLYGPWIGLRAALVFDMDGPEQSIPLSHPCPSDEPAFEKAVQLAVQASKYSNLFTMPLPAWKHWLAVRDVCSIGKDYRYSEDQIEYHYTVNSDVLWRCIK